MSTLLKDRKLKDCPKTHSDKYNILLSIIFRGATLIRKDGKDPKKREYYWQRTLKTYAPFGLNIEDSV